MDRPTAPRSPSRDSDEWNGMTTDRASGSQRPAPRRLFQRALGDDGFSLLEVLVSLMVIGTLMAGTAPFLIKSVSVVSQQRTEQVAVELAGDALERARALTPSSLLAGRGVTAMRNQLSAAPAEVKNVLDQSQLDAASLLATATDVLAGTTAPLPTTSLAVTVGGVEYQQSWYVGSCFQTKADSALLSATVADCVGTEPAPSLVPVQYFRVVVSVTWKHTSCAGSQCVYVASTLINPNPEPLFDLKRPAPTIVSPGTQTGYVGDAVSLQIVAAGGTLPRTWTLTGLPPGLTCTSAGLISGSPTTAGTYTVSAHVRDRELKSDDATFTWIVADPPVLVSPGAQVFRTSTAVSLPITLNGGLRPATWTATGLPAGLAINPATGVITGTPLTTQATPQTATVTAVDSGGKTVSTTFTWQVSTYTPLTLGSPGTQNVTQGDDGAYNLAALAAGGLKPYTWKATGLPAGVTINPNTGVTSGIITAGTRYLVTAEVTDAVGGKASIVVLVNVANRTPGDIRVTTPNPASPNQTSRVGVTVSLTAASAGPAGHAWTATGLPPGLTISTAGVVTGKPTTVGTYTTTLTITGGSKVAHLMFLWTVTA